MKNMILLFFPTNKNASLLKVSVKNPAFFLHFYNHMVL